MKILVAIDGSEHALRALRHALSLAARMPEPHQMVLVHVHHDAPLRGAGSFVGQEALDTYLDQQAQAATDPAEQLCKAAPCPAQVLWLRGPIAQTLAETAAQQGCELLVLGTKGRGAVRDWLLGSTAQRIASLSRVPVLLVP
jgi:nucleotide-binding universal stress UspA family protein